MVRQWDDVVNRPDAEVPLARAALLISAAAHPTLDVGAQLRRLDAIAARVAGPGVEGVCDLLFGDLSLRGDRRTYDDPDNSYLDRVLDRRCGIPISLSVLLIEIAGRCGVRLEGVGLPGHFLVRDPTEPGRLIDAYGGGRRLGRRECERLVHQATGVPVALTDAMLAPVGTRLTLARMLANLDRSFEQRGDRQSLLIVSELRRRLPGAPVGDRVQLAGRLADLGVFDVAADVLDDAARRAGPGSAPDRIASRAAGFRARLN